MNKAKKILKKDVHKLSKEEELLQKIFGLEAHWRAEQKKQWELCKIYRPDYFEQAEVDFNRLSPAHQKSWHAYYQSVDRAAMEVSVRDLLASDRAGCYCCLRIFNPHRLRHWLQNYIDGGGVVLCPYCGMDAVLTSSMGYPITKEFLANVHLAGWGCELRPSRKDLSNPAPARPGKRRWWRWQEKQFKKRKQARESKGKREKTNPKPGEES
jgi:hypothetical protein